VPARLGAALYRGVRHALGTCLTPGWRRPGPAAPYFRPLRRGGRAPRRSRPGWG
jgi:hypothetical protein